MTVLATLLTAAHGRVPGVPARAPVDPSPDEATSLLRRELLRPEYHDRNLMERFMDWLRDQFEAGLDAASQVSAIGTVGASIIFLVLLLLLGWLISRARRSPRRATEVGAVLTDERVTAAQLRLRAESALAAGDPGQALVDAFRALTVRQIEDRRLADLPGTTAHEVATALGDAFGDQRPRIDDAAALFDLVLYGDRPATADQARGVLALDHDLAGVR